MLELLFHWNYIFGYGEKQESKPENKKNIFIGQYKCENYYIFKYRVSFFQIKGFSQYWISIPPPPSLICVPHSPSLAAAPPSLKA